MKIIHFADLHLGIEGYGRTDPLTGLSSRLADFLTTFDKLIEYAIEERVDLVIFCGDAYKSREPSQTQQREFAKRIRRLSEAGISVFLLVGNHDMPNAVGRATTTEIFDTLAVKNIYVANRPGIFKIETTGGAIQIMALPWMRRSILMSKEETKNLTFSQINEKMQEKLTNIINDSINELDPGLPSILASHIWITGVHIGSEDSMTIGQEHVLLPGNVANQAFDYIALGHIHRHQVISENPPVVYAGSLDRLDFGDEADDKGFYLVEIEKDKANGKRNVSYSFHALEGRRFITIQVEVKPQDTDPTQTVLNAINKQGIKGAIVRLQINLAQDVAGQIKDSAIKEVLNEASYFTISKDIKRENRIRLASQSAEEIVPSEALQAWLDSTKVPEGRAKILMNYGKELISKVQQGEKGA
ncbi:MAG: exonuclease SbcCD subunit D [Dehalococcoidales bacterium]|nr:exonuclease SbcCD subunit D [Dehalococcoidales bacterium]